MAPQAPAKPKAGAPQQQAAPPPPLPFRVGVYQTETNDYDNTITMGTGTVNFPNYVLTPNGWLRGLWCLFECITSGNTANVTYTQDAVFAAIQKVVFLDVGNREIFGPLLGYEWMLIMKFGGYFEIGDPRSDVSYNVVSGTAGNGGSFTMVMYLPLEVVHRDALGDIENKSSSSSFKVLIVLDKASNVYSTSPTTLGTVRLRIVEDGYTEPEASDSFGRPLSQAPPAAGTIQYWTSENTTLNAGMAKYLVQNGLGYSMRNLIFRLVDGSTAAAAPAGSRAAADPNWPDPVTLNFGKIQLFQRYQKIWWSKMAKNFGLTSAQTDISMARENGVYPVWFNQDFGLRPGVELRNGYLNTKPGNVLQWSGTLGSSGVTTPYTFFVLVNYVIPPSNDPARLRAAR